jgi:hypothetical protein
MSRIIMSAMSLDMYSISIESDLHDIFLAEQKYV